MKVNCANSGHGPRHVAEDDDIGPVGVALPPGRVERDAARLQRSPGGGPRVQPAGRLLSAPPPDAGRELAGQRLDRPPQLVQLDRGQLRAGPGSSPAASGGDGSAAVVSRSAIWRGQLAAELLQQPGQLLALEEELQLA